ncbi:7420_t:CDS:2, partial [Scutellospora calospora]
GNVMSKFDFGASYLEPVTNNWIPNEYFINNIDPQKGFFRLSATRDGYFEWWQYEYTGNGNYGIFASDRVQTSGFSFQLTVIQTLNGGYAIVYANSTKNTIAGNITSNFTLELDSQFNSNAGIYAIILNYNQTITPQAIILHEMPTPNVNITFSSLTCSVDYVFIGQTCIVAGKSDRNVTFYIKIRFLSSGSMLELVSVLNIISSPNIRTLPLGGYALISRQSYIGFTNFTFSLYDENSKLSNWIFPQQSITSNLVGSFDILQNNTMLVAQNETYNSWNLLSIDLPSLSPYNDSGYGNLHVNSTSPQRNSIDLALNTKMITIKFNDRVSLSNGNLAIYQKINQTNILRQTINSRACDNSNCTAIDKIVQLNILDCTFNEPGGQYFIQMDNNFVKSSDYGESLLGINPNIWTFKTDDVHGILRLTTDGSLYFQSLNDSAKYDFFTNLTKELSVRIPTEKNRLSSNEHYQFDSNSQSKILIPLTISAAKIGEKLLSTDIMNNLNQLIKNKAITGISTGNATYYLDDTYGFQTTSSISDFFEIHKTKFILLSVFIAIFLLKFIVARLNSPEGENFTILQLGITIFRIVTVTTFVFTDAKTIKVLYIPSVFFFVVPITFNLVLAFTVLFVERDDEFVYWFSKYGRISTSFALLSGANIDVLLMLKSRLMKLQLFNAPLSDKSLKIIFWGSCADIFLSDIPQFTIQCQTRFYSIIHFNSIRSFNAL